MNDEDRVLVPLEPPPGGPASLRRRLAAERRRELRQAGYRRAGVAALAVALGVATALKLSPSQRPAGFEIASRFDPFLAATGLVPEPAEALVIAGAHRHESAALRVPLASDRVDFYLVATTLAAPASTEANPPG